MEKKLLITLTLPLSFLINAPSMAFPIQPQKCPSISEIQSVGVSHHVAQDNDGLWFTGRRSQTYHTGSNWTFVIGKITATAVDDAYSKAVAGLGVLSFELGPVMGPIGKWVCYYRTTQFGYTAVAVNPPVAVNIAAPHLKS